jgi:diguanylate cyclase (GGDEF)-like protein
METTDTGLPPRFSGLVPAGTDGTGHGARHRHPRVSAGSGAETPGILADGLPTLARVHGVVRLPAWDLAVECVDEALDSGAVPSLERLARPAQVGSLPSFIAALEDDGDPGRPAGDFARERKRLGLAPAEIAAELLVLGRVLERRGEVSARSAVDRCVVDYVDRLAGELADGASRDPLTGLLDRRAFYAQLSLEAARARRYRGSAALVLFELDRSEEEDRDRLRRALAAALMGTVRETDVAGRVGGEEFAALLPAAGPHDADAFGARLRQELPDGLSFSAGAACFPDECAAVEQLVQRAERRLSSDKAAKAA